MCWLFCVEPTPPAPPPPRPPRKPPRPERSPRGSVRSRWFGPCWSLCSCGLKSFPIELKWFPFFPAYGGRRSTCEGCVGWWCCPFVSPLAAIVLVLWWAPLGTKSALPVAYMQLLVRVSTPVAEHGGGKREDEWESNIPFVDRRQAPSASQAVWKQKAYAAPEGACATRRSRSACGSLSRGSRDEWAACCRWSLS